MPRQAVLKACDREIEDCWRRFVDIGQAWAGDVNRDDQEELIIFPGTGGTGGDDALLLQRKKGRWHILLDYFPYDSRFLILPRARDGYHDLCLDSHHCFKWIGEHYAAFETNDYRSIPFVALETRDPRDATLRWMARYAGINQVRFSPDWYEVSHASELGKRLVKGPEDAWAMLQDGETGIRWVSLYKAGVWGVKGRRAFLLLPRSEHKGAEKFVIDGDWLIILADRVVTSPQNSKGQSFEVGRYNRRTASLVITTSDPFWLHKITE